MKTKISTLIFIVFLFGCTKVPITGRKQMKLIPASEMQSMSYQNYAQFLRENRITANANYSAMIKKMWI